MIKPIGKRVLIEVIEVESITRSGIYIPETSKEKPNQGLVINVGITSIIKIGDKVIFPKHGGTPIEIEGKNYLIMFEDDIYAVI